MASTKDSSSKHPKGLYLLFFTEMAERFSYYGMRAILALFLVKEFMFDKTLVSDIYGSFTGLVYLTPIIGGLIADRYWGNRRSIFLGGILMAIGQFLLFYSGSVDGEFAKTLMYVGLGFLIGGNGFFKPNISTMVGQLYPEGDPRIDSAYTIFYMGINLGGFLSPLVCGYLGETFDFKWGFLAAGIAMIISTISFELLKNKFLVTPEGKQIGEVPLKVVVTEGNTSSVKFSRLQYLILFGGGGILFFVFYAFLGLDMIAAGIFAFSIVVPTVIILDSSLSVVERSRIWVVFISAFFVIFFWSAFEQAGASLTFFADEQTDRTMFGWVMPASWFNSFNSVFIVVFAPIFSFLWAKLRMLKVEPSAPRKQAWGLLLLAAGYLWIAVGVRGVAPGMKVGMVLLTGLYLIHTWGELCLSPIGLSMVNKLSPARLASLLMGVWFLSSAAANKFAGTLSTYYPVEQEKASVYKVANSSISIDGGITLKWDDVVVSRNAPLLKHWVLGNSIAVKGTSETTDSLVSLAIAPGSSSLVAADSFKVKRTYPEELNPKEIKQMAERKESAPKFISFLLADGKHAGVLIQGKTVSTLEIWDLYPKTKKFLGYEIKNLYDFFMIFVWMAGLAALLLFLISGKMKQMMGGL